MRAPGPEGISVLTTFSQLGLAEPVLRAVTAEGYEVPTPIQARAIPLFLTGRDMVGLAQTGTGKTAAFVLPLLTRLLADNKKAPGLSCRALILAPTRELAAQIGASVAAYGKFTGLTHTVVYGGAKAGPQIRALARGVDVLVATPGRLLDHMQAGKLRLDLTRTVVLDEADQMLDLGFMPAIRRILQAAARPRTTVMFSATMPQAIRQLADDFLDDPATISVSAPSRPIEAITQSVFYVDGGAKPEALIDLLAPEAGRRAIIFTRTKRGADKVTKRLVEYGHKAAAIHGNKTQGQRERALAAFRSGAAPVLVATDIAARGIDVDGIELVVNYELPNVAESYVHRIGRTARAGATGRAVSLVAPDERGLLKDIEKLTGKPIAGLNEAPPMARGAAARPARPQQKRGGGGGGGGGGRPRAAGSGGGERGERSAKGGQGGGERHAERSGQGGASRSGQGGGERNGQGGGSRGGPGGNRGGQGGPRGGQGGSRGGPGGNRGGQGGGGQGRSKQRAEA
ncbi:MAG: DEAD/DEAH box helicase [Alphaproteobacteria bacterium]|nr:DEAD/DEAH box helicase [Alphaproteobacteria bacterium]